MGIYYAEQVGLPSLPILMQTWGVPTLRKEVVHQNLPEEHILPEETLESTVEMVTESQNVNLTISLQTVLMSGWFIGAIGILYSVGLFLLTKPTSALGDIASTNPDLLLGLLVLIEAAVFEETIYRLCMQNFLVSKFKNTFFAILLTSIVWTLFP